MGQLSVGVEGASGGEATESLTALPAAVNPVKRLLDILGAAVLLILLLPLLASIAVAIRLESSGPAIFRQHRGGLHGRPFVILKFRTMRALDDGEIIVQATTNDPRITPVGALLRRSSMDELPQLWNVLKGDMSFVGPRPHALAHDDFYGQLIANYHLRFLARPGLTGMAQVAGLRGETAELGQMADRVRLDLRYVEEWSLLLDLKLLLGTPKALASKKAR